MLVRSLNPYTRDGRQDNSSCSVKRRAVFISWFRSKLQQSSVLYRPQRQLEGVVRATTMRCDLFRSWHDSGVLARSGVLYRDREARASGRGPVLSQRWARGRYSQCSRQRAATTRSPPPGRLRGLPARDCSELANGVGDPPHAR